MLIEGQDLVKELVKRFSTEEFAWIDDIFLEEEEDEHEEEQIEDNPADWISAENVIDIENENITDSGGGD